jgi:hypothetical protein
MPFDDRPELLAQPRREARGRRGVGEEGEDAAIAALARQGLGEAAEERGVVQDLRVQSTGFCGAA